MLWNYDDKESTSVTDANIAVPKTSTHYAFTSFFFFTFYK